MQPTPEEQMTRILVEGYCHVWCILSRHKGWGCQPGAWRTLRALKTLILKLKKEKKERKLKKERVLAD